MAPVVPSTPLGISTATTFCLVSRRQRLRRRDQRAGGRDRGRARGRCRTARRCTRSTPLKIALDARDVTRPGPAGGRSRRVAAQPVGRRRGRRRAPCSAGAQQPRRDIAVAAIVARTAEHQHAPPAGALKNVAGRARDRHGGALHQRHAGTPLSIVRRSARAI